jgi:hypothetical protein
MREMKRPVMKPRRMMKLSEAGKHGLMLRRAGNHNAHIRPAVRGAKGERAATELENRKSPANVGLFYFYDRVKWKKRLPPGCQ